MRVLIDGYNLLFQSGIGGRHRGPGWIVQARNKLIDYLAANLHAEWSNSTTIVFDRSQGREQQCDFVSTAGAQVLFAIDHPEADDLIEELISKHSAPKSLIVVSSDLRIRRKAMARRAQSLDSETFLNQIENGEFRTPVGASTSSKGDPDDDSAMDETLSDAEVRFWLREFGDL